MRPLLAVVFHVAGAAASTVLDDSFPYQGSYQGLDRRDSSNCTLYTLHSGDTCISIASETNTTFAQLLSWNSEIDLICSNLENLTDICISNPLGNYAIPTTATTTGSALMFTTPAAIPTPTAGGSSSYCGEYYRVESGQDCGTIEQRFGIDLKDFLFLNPEVLANCTNLLADTYYCVEPVGAISSYSGYLNPTSTTSAFKASSFTPLPNIGDPLAKFSSSAPVIPLANGTRLDCADYIWLNTTNTTAADCWSLAQVYGIASLDIVLWNPSLEDIANVSTTVFTYPCTLSASSSYCVALVSTTTTAVLTVTTPSPIAAGEIANCTNWWAPQSYNTCADVLALYELTIEQFYAMNPSVGSDCRGMALGTYYCVSTDPGGVPPSVPYNQLNSTASSVGTGVGSSTGIQTPSPIQTGLVSNCDNFYYVVANDTCYDISANYNISLSDFYAWNPAVGSACNDLEANEYVCVGVAATSSTPTTATPTSTATGLVTPTPTQSGMVNDCTKFYLVIPNDGCYDIAAKYNISLDDFYAWNPAIDNCADLYPNYYVCVGIEL